MENILRPKVYKTTFIRQVRRWNELKIRQNTDKNR